MFDDKIGRDSQSLDLIWEAQSRVGWLMSKIWLLHVCTSLKRPLAIIEWEQVSWIARVQQCSVPEQSTILGMMIVLDLFFSSILGHKPIFAFIRICQMLIMHTMVTLLRSPYRALFCWIFSIKHSLKNQNGWICQKHAEKKSIFIYSPLHTRKTIHEKQQSQLSSIICFNLSSHLLMRMSLITLIRMFVQLNK